MQRPDLGGQAFRSIKNHRLRVANSGKEDESLIGLIVEDQRSSFATTNQSQRA
jgi:hypothetical protein